MLVVGELPEPIQQLVSQRVLGDQHLDRGRILALLGPTSGIDGWFPGQVSASSAGSYVIDRPDLDRSATASSSVENAFGFPEVDSDFSTSEVDSDLPASGDESDAATSGADPGVAGAIAEELDPILDQWDVRPTRLRLVITPANGERPDDETTEAVVESMKVTDGMAYLFLPGTDVFDLDDELTSRVDAVIEVRTRRPGDPEHRWIIPQEEVATEWMPVLP